MFQHQRIARHQGRGGGAKYLPERKVPRHDGQHHAERVIRDIAFAGVRFHRIGMQKIFAMLRIVVADSGTLFDFGAGLFQRLAHFQRDQGRVPVMLRAQLFRRITQRFGAF